MPIKLSLEFGPLHLAFNIHWLTWKNNFWIVFASVETGILQFHSSLHLTEIPSLSIYLTETPFLPPSPSSLSPLGYSWGSVSVGTVESILSNTKSRAKWLKYFTGKQNRWAQTSLDEGGPRTSVSGLLNPNY